MLEDNGRRLRLPTTREEVSKPLDPYTPYVHTLYKLCFPSILVKTKNNDYLLGYKGIINTRRILIRRKVFWSRILSGPLYPKLSTCFEGTRLTQLVQPVTAGRLFPCHKGRVDLYIDECLCHCICFGHEGFLLQVSPRVTAMAWSGRRTDVMQRVLRILSRLDLKHDEHRRARISRGYKAGELQPHYLILIKY